MSLSLFLSVPSQAQPLSRVYPAAPGEPLSSLFQVNVEEQPSPVYLASVGSLTGPRLYQELVGKASFTSFDINGPVLITVTYAKTIQQARILPASSGLQLSISGNQVSFRVTNPGQFTLEINGDWNNSLHLFANAPEVNPPSPTDPTVIYFGPGVHVVQSMTVKTGQTVYIAAGAVLYWRLAPGQASGPLFTLAGSNITFRGRGIIDSSAIPQIPNGNIIYAKVSGLTVEGVVLRDAANWTFHINNSSNVQVSNIKVFGWRLNSDGTDIDTSQNVTLSNSFYRTYDDLIAVKTNNSSGNASNIVVKNCILWNEKAHALTIGSELKLPVTDVLFIDSDVIHDKGHDVLFGIFNGDSGIISNVTFENLTVEESMRLMSLYVGPTNWSTTASRGSTNNIIFKNIVAPAPSRVGPNFDLEGFGAGNEVSNTIFSNVTVAGASLQMNEVQQNQFVQGSVVLP